MLVHYPFLPVEAVFIQLFRKTLSEKVHATIPKGIVGGFEINVLHRNFERMAREAINYVSECYSDRNSVLIISHVTFRDCRVHFFLRQPFSK